MLRKKIIVHGSYNNATATLMVKKETLQEVSEYYDSLEEWIDYELKRVKLAHQSPRYLSIAQVRKINELLDCGAGFWIKKVELLTNK